MRHLTLRTRRTVIGVLAAASGLIGLLFTVPARAAVPGITGPTFNLSAGADYSSQPDGAMIYSWGYGCDGAPGGFAPFAGTCPAVQLPGPTLIVTEGDTVTVRLRNNLPPAAGNTSIVFPGFNVTATGGVSGVLAREAAPGGTVTYTFTASRPGTFAYHSGSQPELQIEMGMFGAVIVRPANPPVNCRSTNAYSLAKAAYDHPGSCYDREYLFQLSEIDARVHDQARAQVLACPVGPCPKIAVRTEPFRPNYFLINGRSMPDNMDKPYAGAYAHQPYNSNPHMHPGELVLMRIIGQGRWQHPFHFHGNHARVLARDANLILSAADGTSLAGPMLFTTPSISGQTQDQIFTWTGKGLNWDVYNHKRSDNPQVPCVPDANGFHAVPGSPNFGEWCADHLKPIPVVPPDPTIVVNGQWYAGTPYLGLQQGGYTNTPQAPGTLNQNPPAESGYAYMWHSHNEREITTNDVFPGGMLTMLLVDPASWFIDETL